MSKVFIVEDSPDNMKLSRPRLTMRGHEVVGLAGGEGLLDIFAEQAQHAVAGDPPTP